MGPSEEIDANPKRGTSAKRKIIFFDYDSTLNPGQSNDPIPKERIELLRGFIGTWRAENEHLSIYVHTASSVEKKREGLQEAGLDDLFEDVFSSGIGPTKSTSKGAFLAGMLRDHPEWSRSNVLHVDDSISAISSIIGGGVEEGGAPLCHTLRLPQHGAGLSFDDMVWIRNNFLINRITNDLVHAHSFYLPTGERVVDSYDSQVKCMYDELPSKQRADMFQNCIKDGRIVVDAFKALCRGRPDYAASAGITIDAC